ncbi:integrase, catalytic region, zinc finger, CCHC-type containing protein, partial [Tanacetum coccineum]
MPQNLIQIYEIFDVEAKSLPTNDAWVVVKFLKQLFSRFGTPRAIISDRERTVGEHRAKWADKLDDALWAFCTAFKTPFGCTPCRLVYGKACHLPIELEHKAYWVLKWTNFYLKTAANLSKDIQCVGSDTRPPMLDKTDFASWQQRIRLYCWGKENEVQNELESILTSHLKTRKGIKLTFGQQISSCSELTKEDRESQLYDDFEHFRQNKGETIHDYYVRFVTTVKLNRRLSDLTRSAFADNTQLDSRLSPTDNLIENLTNTLALLIQSYKTYLPQTNNQLKTSSNARNQATIQDGRVVIQNVQGRQNRGQGNNARGTSAKGYRGAQNKVRNGTGAAGYKGAQNRIRNANPGQARRLNVTTVTENGVTLDKEQLLFIAGGQDNTVNEDVDEQPVQDLALTVDNVFQADDCDAFDSDVD